MYITVMCRWIFSYKSSNHVSTKVVNTRAKRTKANYSRKRIRRNRRIRPPPRPTYTAMCYDNNGLFNQVLDSRSTEFPNNTDGFGMTALIGNEWTEFRSMDLPNNAPNLRSWLRLVDAAKPRMFIGHLRANTVARLDSNVAHTHPYVIQGKHKTVSVMMNGYIDGYADKPRNVTDTLVLGKQICERVNSHNESLKNSIDGILRNIQTDFRMTLCVVVTEPGKSPKHYVSRCINWDTEPPTLYHSRKTGIYASETLYDGGDWELVPVTRFHTS